jgi:hypothetical protein
MKKKIRNWDFVKKNISDKGAFNTLNELRKTSSSDYRLNVQFFRRIAIADTKKLWSLGTSEFGHLLWSYPSLNSIPLKKELAWASAWLSGQSAKINSYRRFANELQELVLIDAMDVASAKLDDFCVKNGWSFWAVELRLALEQLNNGTEAQKQLSAEWKLTAPNTFASLIAQIVSDRNDPAFSYDGFYWNCLNSFPRFTSADWLPTYLLYRSLSYLDNTENSLSIILSRELTSNLIDYYEAIIETLFNIANDTAELRVLRPQAIHLIDDLIKDGYSDSRLQKLRFALTGIIPSNNSLSLCYSASAQLLYDACISRFSWDEEPSNLSLFLQGVLKDINQCSKEGVQMQEAITNLIMLGTNLKSLDIGVVIGFSQQLLAGDLTSRTVLPLGIILTAGSWQFDEMAALDDESIRRFLESSAQTHKQANSFLNVLNGQSVESLKITNSLSYLWLDRQLIMQQRWSEALWLCDRLSEFDSFWYRQSAKLRLSVFIEKSELKNALELMSQWLLKGAYYASEFPIAKIFTNRSWSIFSNIDPILVGFVSHHSYIVTQDHDIHYICKQACKKIAVNGGRTHIAERFKVSKDENEHARLLAFMRDVWVETNFAFIDYIQSTEDAQNEQMQVMQLLMEWDEDNLAEYVENIKELTLDQTLRNGLKQIDQTRVFVNEVALYRWAEKELYQDYERWIKLLESQSNATLVDDLVRQYLVAPNGLDLLQALGDEPTESDALLIKLLERLFERFLNDPNEGLDCYLSLRIRHGSLRGTLFGALEEQRLLYSSTGFSRNEFDKYWGSNLDLSEQNHDLVVTAFETFTTRLRGISDELINERVQIISDKKLKGMITAKIDPKNIRLFARLLSERNISFQSLICTGFFVFWKLLESHLANLGSYVRQDVKTSVQAEFHTLSTKLRDIGSQTQPLITVLCKVATTTQSRCDTIADWFKPPQISGEDNYVLPVAIEIAKTATTNVYRAFPANVRLRSMPEQNLSLSPSGLSVVADCLFVIFENAWKHSGLKEHIGTLDLDASFDSTNKLLTLKVFSDLSETEIERLNANKLEVLKAKYLSQDHSELARCEGGSGFAKLSRLTRFVERTLVSHPLEFDIVEEQWMIQISIPFYEREGLYEAYG